MLFTVFLFSSCNNDDACRQNRYVAMKVNFYQVQTNTLTGDVRTISLSLDSLTVKGVDNDSVLLNNQKRVNTASIKLHKFENKTLYVFTFNDVNDTISILHQNEDELLSFECGYLTTHTIDTVYQTYHFIDSLAIKSRIVNATLNEENLSLYKYTVVD